MHSSATNHTLSAQMRLPTGLFLLFTLAATCCAQMKPGDRRKAYGEARASVIESLLTTLYPGAVVQWDPALTVQVSGGTPRMVEVPVSVRGSATGGMEGVASIEFEGRRQQYIFEAQGFRRTDPPAFPTVLYVFRADRTGHIERYKEVALDPDEPLTELKNASLQSWQKEWPVLDIRYDTHRATSTSFTTIEWHGALDAGTGEFISRLPFGITRRLRGAPERDFYFSLGRTGYSTIMIGSSTGESHPYYCSDPCVVDAETLLSDWKLNDAPTKGPSSKGMADNSAARFAATIHLKNGRTIRAESAIETGDKVEYTVGESVYQIPRNLVQEISHSENPVW
ncbi:MAG: hypothetical protein ABSD39_08480 [Terriglobales bacterium]|jgi:hypothetical protein